MAKSSSSSSPSLLPLLILFLFLLIGALIAYAVYNIATSVADQTSKKMEKKHVVFTKEGMKVHVKEVGAEREADRTQSLLVKTWNLSTWPAYKSRYWNKEGQGDKGGQGGGTVSGNESKKSSASYAELVPIHGWTNMRDTLIEDVDE
ncbi:MAG: hypothetical protein LQ338_005647 [Usnochroma carphineum]|nr:MAG: hypothetical protein LQ338_005647 [Usnochroma carphineum]